MDDFTSNYLKKRAAFLGAGEKSPSHATEKTRTKTETNSGKDAQGTKSTDSFTQNYLKKKAQLLTASERLGGQSAAEKPAEPAEKKQSSTLVKGSFDGTRKPTQGQNEPNWAKIAGGTVLQGLDQFAQGASATLAAAEGLVTKPLGYVLGNNELYKDGLFYVWNEKIKEEQQKAEEQFAPEYEKAGKVGEVIQKFGPSTVAAIPQAAMAFFTAGQSLAAQGTTAALQGASAAAQGAGIAQTASTALQQAAKNPQFWTSFMTTAGNEYEQAKADGADDLKAYAYGTITGLLNSIVEIGGGIDTLPDGSKKAVREWVESMIDEGKEEVIQGAISQLSQAAVYGKENPLFSTTNQDAVINPYRAGEEFLGGAIVGGLLGGGQIAVQRTLNALGEAGVRARNQAQAQAQVQMQGQVQERNFSPAETREESGLTLTMPEELAEPGDWQSVQARQQAVTDQVRQRINEEGVIADEENVAGGIGDNGQSQLDPGGQAAGVPGAAGAAQSGRGKGYRARDLGAALDAAGTPLISAREFFGDQNLSEDSYVRELPQNIIDADEGLWTIYQKIRDTGYTPRLYSGTVRQEGKNLQINGMISDTDVFIRADSVRYTPEQIWDHEQYHIAADRDPSVVKQAAAKLMRDFGPDIPNQVLAKYIEAYKGVYTGRELTTAALEEMLADAYAGKDTFRANVQQFTDTVRQMTPQVTQDMQQARGPPRFTFGGTNAAQADLQALEQAQTMEQQGVDAETIRRDTGWFRGADQKWRFEIDDSAMEYDQTGNLQGAKTRRWAIEDLEAAREDLFGSITEEQASMVRAYNRAEISGDTEEQQRLYDELVSTEFGFQFETYVDALQRANATKNNSWGGTLADYINHEELFKNYPQLRDVGLQFQKLPDGTRGEFDGETVILDESLLTEPEDVMIHEIQHAIQKEEGFARGSNKKYWEEKLKNGYDGRTPSQQREIARLREEYNGVQNQEPEFFRDMVQLWEMAPDIPRGEINWDTLEQIEPDPPEWQRYDAERERLERTYGQEKVWGFIQLQENIKRVERNAGRSAYELYQKTAGEIEARNAAARRTMTQEQRRETAPNTGDENTVFANAGGGYGQEYVGVNEDGIEVYETSEDVRRLPWKERKQRFLDIMRNQYRGRTARFDANGDVLYAKFDERDLSKNIYGDKKSSPAGRDAKINVGADGGIFDLVEHAKYKSSDSEQGKPTSAHRNVTGWEYFVKTVQIDGQVFDLLANIRKKPNGEYVYSIQLNENNKKSASPVAPAYGLQQEAGYASEWGTADGNSISQSRQKSKGENLNQGIRYSAETDTQQDMEAETLRKLADLMPGVKRRDLQAIMSDIKGGVIEAQLMADFWDQYDNIRVADYTKEAQELQEVRRALQGRKIYADDSLKAEFGDDWNDIRKKAFGNRLYFTSKRGDGVSGLDQINQELAGQFPQLFNEADTDPAAIMDNILTVLERSGENTISLDEEAAKYGGSEAVNDFRQSYVNQFLDIAREYRDQISGMEEAQKAERKAARDTERKRLDDYITKAREILRQRYIEGDYSVPALALRSIDQETGKAVDIDDYVRRKEQEAREKKEERLRHIPKEDFKGSKNLERLGVKIDGTVTDYFGAEGLRANDKAMRSIKKELRAAEKRLRATAKEKSIASQIVSGELTEEDIPATVNRDKVMELADYYMAERAAGTGMIQQRRQDINRLLDERMKEIFKDAPDNKLPGAITLNHRTPERVMLSAFGDKEGAKINKALIEPVKRNEAERIRFINRELDKVRKFQDSTGKESALTKEERAAVQQTIEGRAAEEIIAGMEMGEAIKQVGENLKAGEDAMDLQLEFPLSDSERKLAKQYARWLEAQEAMDNNKVDRVKVENAAKKYSELFDQYYEAINDFLVVHGYQPIGFIKGYAPHLQPQDVHNTLSNVMRSMGLLDDVSEIPTSIAGLTGDFRPSKKWNPFFLTRQTDNAQQDIAAGFESYIQYLSDVLYHTDDIMRIRAAERYFRKTYAPEDIKAQLEQAEDLRWMPQEDKEAFLRENGIIKPGDQMTGQQAHQALQDYIDQQYRTLEEKGKYSNLAPWLQNYANILAGKQTWADRGMESEYGRKSLNVANKIMRTLSRSQVAGNISTVLNQTAQIPQIIADAGAVNTAQAMRDMIDGRLRRTGFTEESDFLSNKKGINFLVNTPGEMVTSALFKPAELMDRMVSTLATRSGYLKAIKEGKSDADAMRYADRFAEKVMGSRAKGSRPLAFENKNILSQMVHLYQIEAMNSWEHLTQDLPRDFREIQRTQGKEKAALALAGVIVKMLFSAFLLNRAAEETYGGTPAPYDILGLTANFIASGEGLTANQWLLQVIDNGTEKLGGERIFGTTQAEPQEFDWESALDDAKYQVMGDLPLVRNVAGILGVGDQTQVWSGLGDAVTKTGKAIAEDGLFSGRTAEELFLLAVQLLPGGNQVRKFYQGAKDMVQGGHMYGYGENARMQYPVEDSLENWIKGLAFGPSALPESREFYAGGAEGGLSANQTQVVKDLVEAGAENQEAFDVIQSMKNSSRTTDKLMELAEAPWDEDIKEIAAESFMGESQLERYMAARKANVSTLDYADFLQEAYKNAADRTGKDDASPSQEDVKNALNDTKLSRSQKRAIWKSYGWKTDSPW